NSGATKAGIKCERAKTSRAKACGFACVSDGRSGSGVAAQGATSSYSAQHDGARMTGAESSELSLSLLREAEGIRAPVVPDTDRAEARSLRDVRYASLVEEGP